MKETEFDTLQEKILIASCKRVRNNSKGNRLKKNMKIRKTKVNGVAYLVSNFS